MAAPAHPSLATFVASSTLALGVAAALFVYGRQEPGRIYAPGPLSSAHGPITACTSCHAPWSGPQQERCTTPGCHGMADRLAAGHGASRAFHETLAGQSCFVLCHREHLGQNAPVSPSFDHRPFVEKLPCKRCHAADIPAGPLHASKNEDCSVCHASSGWSPAAFDHDSTPFALTGAHGKLRCASCHSDSRRDGPPRACIACHRNDDEHRGDYGPDCERCHTTASFARGSFEHSFPIDRGDHRGLGCASCHTTSDYSKFSCVGCHEHSQQAMDGQHHGEVTDYQYDTAACYRCHVAGATRLEDEHGDHSTRERRHGREHDEHRRGREHDEHRSGREHDDD